MSRNSINSFGGTNPFVSLDAEPLSNNQTLVSQHAPQNDLWNGNLIAQKTPLRSQTNDAPQTFWTGKTTDSRELSKKLLQENFGFSPEDYNAYVKKYGELVINDKQKCDAAQNNKLSSAASKNACDWATPGDIAKWQNVGGKVPITLDKSVVAQIENFKREKTIDDATKKIVDPFVRETVKTELTKLATGAGQARIEAAEKLADLETTTFDDAEAVRNAVRSSAAEPLNKNNAVLQVVAAKIDFRRAAADKFNAFMAVVNNDKGNFEKNAYYKEQLKKFTD